MPATPAVPTAPAPDAGGGGPGGAFDGPGVDAPPDPEAGGTTPPATPVTPAQTAPGATMPSDNGGTGTAPPGNAGGGGTNPFDGPGMGGPPDPTAGTTPPSGTATPGDAGAGDPPPADGSITLPTITVTASPPSWLDQIGNFISDHLPTLRQVTGVGEVIVGSVEQVAGYLSISAGAVITGIGAGVAFVTDEGMVAVPLTATGLAMMGAGAAVVNQGGNMVAAGESDLNAPTPPPLVSPSGQATTPQGPQGLDGTSPPSTQPLPNTPTATGDAGRPTPVSPPVTPDDLLPASPSPEERNASLDALAGKMAGNTGGRLVSAPGGSDAPLDAEHLGAAAQEYEKGQPVTDPSTGEVIISPTTGKPVDHVQEVDAAANGLENDIKTLADKIDHNETYVKPKPEGSIADAQHLLGKMRELDDFVRNIIPKGAKAPWNQ